MRSDELDARMRELELFHELCLLPGAWAVIRVDGRSFSRLTQERFEKPFDPQFHKYMVGTAQALLEQLQGVYAYTESDEISVLLPRDWSLFDRGLEKAVSISAGIASATFTLASGIAAHFDSRVILAAENSTVVDYFRWRQADATRCALNGWCYWTLRKAGASVEAATASLEGQPVSFKNELLFQHGTNFNDVPAWQRRGTGLYWARYEKSGFNPKLNEAVTVSRRGVKVDEELPMGEQYDAFLLNLIGPK